MINKEVGSCTDVQDGGLVIGDLGNIVTLLKDNADVLKGIICIDFVNKTLSEELEHNTHQQNINDLMFDFRTLGYTVTLKHTSEEFKHQILTDDFDFLYSILIDVYQDTYLVVCYDVVKAMKFNELFSIDNLHKMREELTVEVDPITSRLERCKDCVCLVEHNNRMVCDQYRMTCENIEECGEQQTDK